MSMELNCPRGTTEYSSYLFRNLNEAEEKEFRQWARDNYKAGDPIDTVWHPVVQDECKKMKYNRMWGNWIKKHIDGLFTNEYAHPLSDLQPNIIAMFKAWYPSNMHIVREFYKWSVHLRTHGKRENYSSQMIVHRIRWETALNSEFDNFKLNQNLGSALGRVVMKLDPQLKGMFRTKSVRCPAMSEDLPIDDNFYSGMTHEDALEMGDPQDLI